MKLHRFIGAFDFSTDRVVTEDAELVHQISAVLRLQQGEACILGDGALHEAVCDVVEVSKRRVIFRILRRELNQNEPRRSVILYCAILKRENFEWAVQKAVEAGVGSIVPLCTLRTVKLEIKEARLNKIIKEAAEQSGRGIVPRLQPALLFQEAVGMATFNERNILFDGSGVPLKEIALPQKSTLGIFVGPEGGWDNQEVELARENSFSIASLGPLTLRAETAAVVSCYEAVQ